MFVLLSYESVLREEQYRIAFMQTTQILYQPKAPGAEDMVSLPFVIWDVCGRKYCKETWLWEKSIIESCWGRKVVTRNQRSEKKSGINWIDKHG